jgi:hypothetical protein
VQTGTTGNGERHGDVDAGIAIVSAHDDRAALDDDHDADRAEHGSAIIRTPAASGAGAISGRRTNGRERTAATVSERPNREGPPPCGSPATLRRLLLPLTSAEGKP